ncbi:MAG: sigma-70 family RNA polymerase sigma factor [Planctomycetes bacterium]|nr:sigma-70 family RNA polymerase sigma factor [Planctomycetota bacterium]
MDRNAGIDPSCDDRRLLQAWLADRDEAALTALLARHRPALVGMARRMLADDQAADDVVQETSISLFDHAGTITGSVGAWLHQTARNLALNLIRSQARRRRHEAETATGPAPADPPQAEADAHLRALVVDCVNALAPAERDLIVDVFWTGRTQHEVAKDRRVSQAAVHKRVHAALGRLRRQLSRRGCATTAASLAALLAAMAGNNLAAAENAWLAETPPASGRQLAIAAAAAGAGLALAGWLAWGAITGAGENQTGRGRPPPGLLPSGSVGEPSPSAVPRQRATQAAAADGPASPALSRPDRPMTAAGAGWQPCPGRSWGYWLIPSPLGPERLQPEDATGMITIRDGDDGEIITLLPPAHASMVLAIPLQRDPVDGVVVALEVGSPAIPAERVRRQMVLAGSPGPSPSLLYWAGLVDDDPISVPASLPAPELMVLAGQDTHGYGFTLGDTGVRTHGLVTVGGLRRSFPTGTMGSMTLPLTIPAGGAVLARVRTRAMGATELSSLLATLPLPPILDQ